MKWTLVLWMWVLSMGVQWVAAEVPEAPLRLVVHLSDGSRLVGPAGLAKVILQTESLGRLEIPLANLRLIKLAKSSSVTLHMANGDLLQGQLLNDPLPLQTLVGRVSIPLGLAKHIEINRRAPVGVDLDGLVAHFPFNGDANDQTEGQNHGRIVGARFVDSGNGQALQTDGNTRTFVVIKRAAALEPAEALSISMWVKGVPGQAAGHGWGTLLRKSDHCQGGYGFRGGGISSWGLAGPNPCGGRTTSISFQQFDPDRWQHIVATYSRADQRARTYQDGQLVGEVEASDPIAHSGDLFLGGANVAGDDGGFRGLISDVRIYNRELTADQIAALHDRGCPVGE